MTMGPVKTVPHIKIQAIRDLRRLGAVLRISDQRTSFLLSVSNSNCLRFWMNSFLASSWSDSSFLACRRLRTASASSKKPCCTSQRGEKGSHGEPTRMKRAGMAWNARGKHHGNSDVEPEEVMKERPKLSHGEIV